MNGPGSILPPVYPFNYQYSTHFRRAPERISSWLPFDRSQVTIFADTPIFRNRLMADFERITIDRCGVLSGEYVAVSDCLFLIDRHGNCISVNFPDNFLTARMPFDNANAPQFWDLRMWILENWNQIPLIEKGTVWSHIYHNNYYHYTFEFLQKARALDSFSVKNIVLPPLILDLPFQRELLGRAIGDTTITFANSPVRMVDPVLVDAWQSYDALGWLRRTMQFSASPGANRYYIRRTPKAKRGGNNISETEEFLAFLKRRQFQTIDFGNGEIPVTKQIEMMQGAGVILAPHGAGLTNMAYMNPPLTIIECFGRRVLSPAFMQIAINLGFKYYGIISDKEDAEQCIALDISRLDQIMDEVGG